MPQSLSYYLTLLVIKCKGLKKTFSKDPIPFEKIREEDVHHPKGTFFKTHIKRNFQIANSNITEIATGSTSDKLLLFVHGGAFVSGPVKHHWDTIKEIAIQTDYNIWMCDYPKAPENSIATISENMDAIYREALKQFSSSQISLIGDSVGGTLITALTQRLIADYKEIPNKIILISPIMDASMSNPDIDTLDLTDPILSKAGVLSAKKMCAKNTDLKNPVISPLYGSFKNFPKTIMYLAENDISYPDQKMTLEKLKEAKVNVRVTEGKNMPHIWPFLPVMKEAKRSLRTIIEILNN